MAANLALGIAFADFWVTLGDGATPEVFLAPCAFNARALNLTKNLNEIIVPDCADEAAPGWIVRDPLSISWDITGEGLLDERAIDVWDGWFLQAETKNVRVACKITLPSPVTLLYTGKAHLQSFTRSANRGEQVMWNCAIMGSGPLIRTPAPAVLGESFMESAEDTAAWMERRQANRAERRENGKPEVKHSKAKEKTKEAA